MSLKPVPARIGAPAPGPPAPTGTQPSLTPSCASPGPEPWTGWPAEARAAWRQALALLRGIAWLIAVGVGIGLAVGVLVPAHVVAGIAGAENPRPRPTCRSAPRPSERSASRGRAP